MTRKAQLRQKQPVWSIVVVTAAAWFHTRRPPPPTIKPPNIQQSMSDTHAKSPPAEGCPTAGQVCVCRRRAGRLSAATPWMQIWMLRESQQQQRGSGRRMATTGAG